jgi:hypothetical protein
VTIGTLYCVTDEDDIVERWSGSVWQTYSPTVTPPTPADVLNQTNGFRLTLASGMPVFNPQSAVPSATDTTNEIITTAVDPNWYNGTIVTPSTTVGGLTAFTRYFLHRISSVTYSFHTTVADAMSGANRVNLTATITATIVPSGISTTGIYLTPFLSNQIALYDGYDWSIEALPELSVGLGTLSSDTLYDLFVDYNGGSPVLSIGAAWSSATVRSVALTRQDGVWVSAADAQSRYVGTFRTNSTTTTIDDGGGLATQVGGKRFLWNAANQIRTWLRLVDRTSTWTYTGATTWRQANANAGNQVEFICGLPCDAIEMYGHGQASATNGAAAPGNGLGYDITTEPWLTSSFTLTNETSGAVVDLPSRLGLVSGSGFHFVAWIEKNGNAAQTSTFYGYDAANNNRLSGMSGSILA